MGAKKSEVLLSDLLALESDLQTSTGDFALNGRM